MNDIIGGMDMQQGNFTTFAADRFGNANSALNLSGGYTYVPPGVYFNSAFTISAWVYPGMVLGSWVRLIDFGNGPDIDNVFIALSYTNSPRFSLINNIARIFNTIPSVQLPANSWIFLVASFDGSFAKFYINSTLQSSQTLSIPVMPNNVNRVNNYIGKSNIAADGYSFSLVDDLRIYHRCLDDIEIQDLMINNV